MKKLIAVIAVMFSMNAAAFVGTGNSNLEEAREFLKSESGGANVDWYRVTFWQGAVAGVSVVYDEYTYPFAVCYPKRANLGQISSVAAKYLVDNPKRRDIATSTIIWLAHEEAWGLKSDPDCHEHEKWKEYQSTE